MTRSRSSLLSDFKDFVNKGNVVDLDPTHPTIDLALKTEDPVWHAMAVSTGYTAMNLHWLAFTDDHEAEFHARMIAHMLGVLEPKT